MNENETLRIKVAEEVGWKSIMLFAGELRGVRPGGSELEVIPILVEPKSPEVSPRAREAAHIEIVNSESGQLPGCAVQNALDAAVAEEREKHAATKRMHEGARLMWEDANKQLSTERAAREKAEAQVEADKFKREEWANIIKAWADLCEKLEQTERERDANRESAFMYSQQRDSLRTQLAAVTRERDNWESLTGTYGGRVSYLSEQCDELHRNLAAAEERAAMWQSAQEATRQGGNNLAKERDTLAQRVAELEKERDGVHVALFGDVQEWRNAPLAIAAREHLARVAVEERDKLRRYYDEIVRELGDDLALKRIRDLTKELAAVRVCFSEASQSAGPTTVHVEALKARCAKLETALIAHDTWHKKNRVEDPRSNPFGTNDYLSSKLAEQTKKALNQSPE